MVAIALLVRNRARDSKAHLQHFTSKISGSFPLSRNYDVVTAGCNNIVLTSIQFSYTEYDLQKVPEKRGIGRN